MTFGKGSSLNINSCIGISNGNYIFSAMTENRKRPREDEGCDFMPLSKRINNLHINNREFASVSSPERIINSNQPNGINLENGINGSPEASNTDTRPTYDPGVNSSQSQYYLDNKLLFELHLERIQRSGQQFPF